MRERRAEEPDSAAAHVVVPEVEERERRVLADVLCKDKGAARLDRVSAEVEVGERRAGAEGRGEGGDACVQEVVEGEVEDAEVAAEQQGRHELAHALGAHVVAAELEVREGGAGAQRLGDDAGACGPEVAVAEDLEAAEPAAAGHDAAEAVDLRGAAEQAERGDARTGGERLDVLQDLGPLCRGRARRGEPVARAHAQRDGQEHRVDEQLHGLGGAAQGQGAGVCPVRGPDVCGDGSEDSGEGVGLEHFCVRCCRWCKGGANVAGAARWCRCGRFFKVVQMRGRCCKQVVRSGNSSGGLCV